MGGKTNFKFYLGGNLLKVPSFGFYESPSDIHHPDRKPSPSPPVRPPSLRAHGHLFHLASAPKNLSGFFKPFSLTKAPHVRLYEDKGPQGIFSCELGDTVGSIRKDGSLETVFKVTGVVMDTAPRPMPDTSLSVIAPMAENDGQIFWQAYEEKNNRITDQARPSRMVWVIFDPDERKIFSPKGDYVAIDPRKFIGTSRSKEPLNKYEALLEPAFKKVSVLKGNKKALRIHVEREWSKFKVEIQKNEHGRRIHDNKQLMNAIHAALYKLAGFSAEEIQ